MMFQTLFDFLLPVKKFFFNFSKNIVYVREIPLHKLVSTCLLVLILGIPIALISFCVEIMGSKFGKGGVLRIIARKENIEA